MDCPVCPKNNIEFRFIQNDFPVLHDIDCDHFLTDYKPSAQEVKQLYSDDYFFKGDSGYEDYTLERDMLIKR